MSAKWLGNERQCVYVIKADVNLCNSIYLWVSIFFLFQVSGDRSIYRFRDWGLLLLMCK